VQVVVAPATPLARSALGVVRLTGDGALGLALLVCKPHHAAPIRPRMARRVSFVDGSGAFDDGILLFFPGPRSVTGEDLVELTCHGNPVIVSHLVDELVGAGARMAEAGEFTRRGVIHGRMDLVAAEGVHTAIEASGLAGVRVARQALDGAHSALYADLRTELCMATAELEARLDQPGDVLVTQSDEALTTRVLKVVDNIEALISSTDRGRVVVDGARVALVGETNVGKSSLFNALLGRRRALVHDSPGTTRDVLEVRAQWGDLAVTLLDTAGERETSDPVEAAGLALAQELTDAADCLVVVLRASMDCPSEAESLILERTADRRRVIVYNGVDRPGVGPAPVPSIETSAETGQGLDALIELIRGQIDQQAQGDADLVLASARQASRLRSVAENAREAVDALPIAGPAVAASCLTDAIAEIDAMTGDSSREGVLDALFARFCIGK
jgi:tRNA modification GTPase